jgi:hypothetical protein
MPLTTSCPSCRKAIAYPEQYAGRTVGCPHCKSAVPTAPLPQSVASRPATSPPPKIGVSAAELQGLRVLGRFLLWGAYVIVGAVLFTAFIQFVELVRQGTPCTVDSWTYMLPSDYATSTFLATAARWIGALGILAGAGMIGWGTFQAWSASPSQRRPIFTVAGIALGTGTALALLMPAFVWVLTVYVLSRFNGQADAWDFTSFLAKLMLLGAEIGFLVAVGVLGYRFREVALAAQQSALARMIGFFLLALIGGHLAILFLYAIADAGAWSLSRDARVAFGLEELATVGLGFLWASGTIGLLIWGTILKSKFDAAVK